MYVVLYCLIGYAAIYEVDFLASYVAALVIDGTLNTRVIHSGFANIRFFNQYQIWSLSIFCLPLLLQKKIPQQVKTVIFIIAAFWVTLLFATDSRGAILSYIFALLITMIIFRGRALPLIKINAQYIAVGLVIYTLLFIIPPFLIHSDAMVSSKVLSTTSSLARLQLWAQAVTYIEDSPWFGIGPMQYAYYPNNVAAHPHNSTLQLAAELGIPSAFLVVSLITWFLIQWGRNIPKINIQKDEHSKTSLLWIALFCSLISGLIYSQVSGVIVTPLSQSMIALIFGIMTGLQFSQNKASNAGPSFQRLKSLPIMIISGAILISLTYLATPQITTRILLPFWGQTVPLHTVGPRFWRLGGIIQTPEYQ